jgi:hypothetical protein
LQSDRREDKEQLYSWKHVQIPTGTRTKNPLSKTAFECGPNLLGVQTGLEKIWQIPQNFYLP